MRSTIRYYVENIQHLSISRREDQHHSHPVRDDKKDSDFEVTKISDVDIMII